MSTTIELIREIIQELPPGQPFTTRMLIGCGSRASVDTALYRMSRRGEIIRLAHGVFVRQEDYSLLGTTVELLMTKTFKKILFSSDSISCVTEWLPVNKTVTICSGTAEAVSEPTCAD